MYTNHFEITQVPTQTYTMYQVSIEPAVKSAARCHQIFSALKSTVASTLFPKNGIYDGKSQFWTCFPLALIGSEQQWTVPLENKQYIVSVAYLPGAEVDANAVRRLTLPSSSSTEGPTQSALRLLQLIVRQSSTRFPHNNTAYFPRSFVEDWGADLRASVGGVTLKLGYFQSVRPTLDRLLVNVDQKLAAFYASGPVIDIAKACLGRNSTSQSLTCRDPRDLDTLRRHFVKVKVNVDFLATRNGRKTHIRTIQDIVPRAGECQFELDGRLTTVREYFQRFHSKTLEYPHFFGVVVSPRNSSTKVIIPAELCAVREDQFYRKRLSEDATRRALKLAVKRPQDRRAYICRQDDQADLQTPLSSYKNSPHILESGMTISDRMADVMGKQLPTPAIEFGKKYGDKNETLLPTGGSWNFNDRRRVNVKTDIRYLVFLNLIPLWKPEEDGKDPRRNKFDGDAGRDRFDRDARKELYMSIRQGCKDIGMEFTQPVIDHIFDLGSQTLEQELDRLYGDVAKDVARRHGFSEPDKKTEQDAMFDGEARKETVFLVLLPSSAQAEYDIVKHWGDVRRGVVTQCIRFKTVEGWLRKRNDDRLAKNIAIKINARLGGQNWVVSPAGLDGFDPGLPMFMGADVGHAGPGQLHPSVASIVWARHANGVLYCAQSSLQRARLEVIDDLRSKVILALMQFIPDNEWRPPSSIVFFRDGLSEGQYEAHARQEILDIEAAIGDAWAIPRGKSGTLASNNFARPSLTYIVVTKRHHVRFFATGSSPQDNKTGNLPPGFTTTRGIDSPYAFDFYLQSHHAIQGTARPAHYIVLQDKILSDSTRTLEHAARLDAIRLMSFSLCHAYAKATVSVSIPAPVYYADLACRRLDTRMRESHRYGVSDQVSADSSGSITESMLEGQVQAWKTNFCPMHAKFRDTMYFL